MQPTSGHSGDGRETGRPAAWLALTVLLVAALAVRLHLGMLGGQTFFPDEYRYDQSVRAAQKLLAGQAGAFSSETLTTEHYGYKVLAVLPALVEQSLGLGDSAIAAALGALCSCACLLLVHALARNLGAGRPEALLAALLYGVSTAATYYSRHLVPYDVALCFTLLALWLLTGSWPERLRFPLSGVCAGLSFVTYNGNWYLVAFAGLFLLVGGGLTRAGLWRRLLLYGAGFALVMILVVAASGLSLEGFLARYKSFATVEHQGDYALGWLVPLQYFWLTEHLLAVLWGVCLSVAVVSLVRGDGLSRRRRFSLLGVATVYGLLVFFSVALHHYGVYGRTSRQMIPFLCLLSGEVLWLFLRRIRGTRIWCAALVLALVAQYAWNLLPHERMVFPREFRQAAERDFASELQSGCMSVVNDKFFYPCPDSSASPSRDVVVREALHPFQYTPYLLEGFSQAMRRTCHETDLRLKLIASQTPPCPHD